jgi:hypothetical protein
MSGARAVGYNEAVQMWFKVAAVLVACASCRGGDTAGDEVDASHPGSDAAGGEPDASPADAASPTSPPPRQTADRFVFLEDNGSVRVSFRPDDEGPGSCFIEWLAGCEVQDCDYSGPSDARSHAGEITIETPEDVAILVPNPDTGEYSSSESVTWSAGDEITITASGGDVPAFSADLRGPAALNPIDPNFSQSLQVDRASPLEFRWEGGTEEVSPGLRCSAEDGRVVLARCPVPAESGIGSIPVEILERLPACDSTFVFLVSEHRQELEPGGFYVRVGARGSLFASSAELVD